MAINRFTKRLRRRFEPVTRRGQTIYNQLLYKPAIALLVATFQEFGQDFGGDLAAVIAYNALLSLFPLLLGLVALAGLFLPSEAIQEQLVSFFEQNFPASVDLLRANIKSIIAVRDTLGIISIILLFWTGSNIFSALGRSINRAWDISVRRPWIKTKSRDVALAFGTGILLLISFGISVAASYIRRFDIPLAGLLDYGGRIFAFLLMLGIFLLVYKYMPNTRTRWHDIWPGALLTAVLFEVARTAFVIYLTRFANYERVYGSLASAIILLVWLYYSAVIAIMGAEFSSEYGRFRQARARGMSPREYVMSKSRTVASSGGKSDRPRD